MTNPLAKYLGTKTGRIEDVNAYDSTHVVCLGEVDAEDEALLGLNNFIYIQQSIDLTGIDFISFRVKGIINTDNWTLRIKIGSIITDYREIPSLSENHWTEFKLNCHHMTGMQAVKIELRYVP